MLFYGVEVQRWGGRVHYTKKGNTLQHHWSSTRQYGMYSAFVCVCGGKTTR